MAKRKAAPKKAARKTRVPKTTAPRSAKQVKSAQSARESRLRLIFNITSEEYEKILTQQSGVCAITQLPANTLYLDHDHEDGLIRGLLGYKVNKGLAFFDDDPNLLEAAAKYLRNPPATLALGERVYGVVGRVTKKAKNRRYGPDGAKTPQPRAVMQKQQETLN